jgi:putative ABC transport system substrate-binding protein
VKRREFVGAAFALSCLPAATAAQPAGKVFRVGWLDFSSAAENLGIFEQAMAARGWISGKTYRIEYRGGEGKVERLATIADDLVRLHVDVLVAPGTPEALAAKKATATVPIVVVGVDDPVERGLVSNLARPGANVTGLANAGKDLNAKMLSLFREIVPRASSVAVLWDSTDPAHRVVASQLQVAARSIGLQVNLVQVQRHTDVEPAFASVRKQGNPMVVVLPSGMLTPRWVADLALRNALPLASTSAGYAYEGGLLAYTEDWNAVFDRVASMVDRILKGAKPGDLPVELPAKFKLVVNARTAQALGLTIPASILLRADHVIS